MVIHYSFAATNFGEILIASTPKGICSLEFIASHEQALEQLAKAFPKAELIPQTDNFQECALHFLLPDGNTQPQLVPLDLHGTEFQLKVWNALLQIPQGETTTYAKIAQMIGKPKACRAVGNAIGKNPVAILVPCHRVVRSNGETGGYKWGKEMKIKLLNWEKGDGIAGISV